MAEAGPNLESLQAEVTETDGMVFHSALILKHSKSCKYLWSSKAGLSLSNAYKPCHETTCLF